MMNKSPNWGNSGSLELEILSVLEASNQLRESAEFELYQLVTKNPDRLDQIAAKRSQSLKAEIAKLKSEAEALVGEIEELTGQGPTMEDCDDKFLALAVNGGANAILTRDTDLLALHPFRGIPILTPKDFLGREGNSLSG